MLIEGLGIIGHSNIAVLTALSGGSRHGTGIDFRHRNRIFVVLYLRNSIVHIVLRRIQRHLQIIAVDIPVLNINDAENAGAQSQTSNHQRRTAGNADDRHEKALFIPE